ncbi:hypothetical protein DMB38_20440 [Streptomyces sp. WAC 06738]|uniref:hypothetical protein n=1 Tax=Streptomyces sp. WAC 06738 TaxID=2203210 RepID=UPI000F70B0B1|nr:hypothetical protein [Streptomyces sp. WAC 06738]AZM47839.1 hypothetical protein DMB38_20440 [Streptomyces sp. WAC 06738]
MSAGLARGEPGLVVGVRCEFREQLDERGLHVVVGEGLGAGLGLGDARPDGSGAERVGGQAGGRLLAGRAIAVVVGLVVLEGLFDAEAFVEGFCAPGAPVGEDFDVAGRGDGMGPAFGPAVCEADFGLLGVLAGAGT